MSKKILIAEDDEGILDAMKLMLELEGYEVRATRDGKTLYDMKEELPDLLLLDIWMSGMNGRDICKYLKSQEQTKRTPIILMSASKDTEKTAREAGADDFLAKPFEIDELVAMVAKYT
ncbi:MAG TPA: response regulator [Ktedonobacteraceae bacterium]|nr:response regulator [Ktedonobacteraceae bacterium]